MTAEEKAKLYNAIGYDESIVDTDLPVEYVAYKAHFKLNTLEVLIRNELEAARRPDFDATVMSLQVLNLCCTVDQRPAASGLWYVQ